LLIYRTEDYKKLKKTIDNLNAKGEQRTAAQRSTGRRRQGNANWNANRADIEPHMHQLLICACVTLRMYSALCVCAVDKKKLDHVDAGSSDAKVVAKKLNALDEQLKARNRDMSMTKMKSTVFVGVILLGVFALLNNLFEGVTVAKLPFEPFSLMRSMSHRGLSGSDPTDASMIFIYVLCQLSIRANIQKYLGFTPANAGPSLFQPPSQ
jgi:uncharacterized membrane protein (DUF106 family)